MSAAISLGTTGLSAAIDLGDALAQIATALRIPVLIAAIGVLLLCALEVGRFAAECWRRRVRTRGYDLGELTARAIAEPQHAGHYATLAPGAESAGAVVDLAAAAPRDATEGALARYELSVQRRLDRTRLLVRAGPALGLMGTLIPLAPGLAALGEGDVSTLAESLRDAFGATVVGLLVGTVAFALTLVRTRMYSEDLVDLEQGVRGAAAMSRIGLGRHAGLDDEAGDPLDGLVNLFDVGMILAVAFLIAGLGLTLNLKGDRLETRQAAPSQTKQAAGAGQERVIPNPTKAPHASGRGTPVGQVYRLPDGRLVYVKAGTRRR